MALPLQESLAVATRTEAMRPRDLARLIIDTTVQPKAVMFPTDAKLINRAREILVRLAKHHGVVLRQSYVRVGKIARIKRQRYAHAHQFKRANKALRKLRTYLGRATRDIGRKIAGNDVLQKIFAKPMNLARRVRDQDRRQRGPMVYPCTPRKWNASAKARRTGPTNAGSTSASPPRCTAAKADSSSHTSQRSPQIPTMATRSQSLSRRWWLWSGTPLSASSPMLDTVGTMRRPITSSRSIPPVKNAGSLHRPSVT